MENGVLALELFSMVFVGELHLQILLLADIHADHLLFKSGNESMAADGQGLMLGRTAGKGNAVHASGVIQVHGVALLNGTVVHVDGAAGLVLILGNAGINHRVSQFLLIHFNGEPLVFAQRHVRTDKHFQMEFQILAFADFVQIDLGPVDGMKVVFPDGFLICVREKRLKGIVIENAFAVQRFNHSAGGLALAESGNIDPSA